MKKLSLVLKGDKIPHEIFKFFKKNKDRKIMAKIGYVLKGELKTISGEVLGLLDDVIYIFSKHKKMKFLGFALSRKSKRWPLEDGVVVNLILKATGQRIIRYVFRSLKEALLYLRSRNVVNKLIKDKNYRVIFYVRWRGDVGKKHYLVGEPIGIIEKKSDLKITDIILFPIKMPLKVFTEVLNLILRGKGHELVQMAEKLFGIYKRSGVILVKVLESDYKFDSGEIYIGEKLKGELPTAHVTPDVVALEIIEED